MPEHRPNGVSFCLLSWLLIDCILGICMCKLLIRTVLVRKFSPGFRLGMDMAFCVGHWHDMIKMLDFHTRCLVGTHLQFWKYSWIRNVKRSINALQVLMDMRFPEYFVPSAAQCSNRRTESSFKIVYINRCADYKFSVSESCVIRTNSSLSVCDDACNRKFSVDERETPSAVTWGSSRRASFLDYNYQYQSNSSLENIISQEVCACLLPKHNGVWGRGMASLRSDWVT